MGWFGFVNQLALIAPFISYEKWVQREKLVYKPLLPHATLIKGALSLIHANLWLVSTLSPSPFIYSFMLDNMYIMCPIRLLLYPMLITLGQNTLQKV
jgi:hypothetical protein